MRISYLSGSYFPSRQANSIHVVRMAAAMRALGHDVVLYGRTTGETCCDADALCRYYGVDQGLEIITLSAFPSRVGRELLYAYQLRSLVARDGADLLYSRHYLAIGACAGLAPFVYEIHGMPFGLSTFVGSYIFHHRNFRGLVAISKVLANDVIDEFAPAAPVIVEPDAVNPVAYDQVKSRELEGNGAFRVGYCGQLYRGRGIELIVELAKRRTDLDFHIVGGEPEAIRGYVESTTHLKNLWFHGFVPPSEVPEFLASFDVLLAPYQRAVSASLGGDISRWLSPMKLFEYMDAGKAIIISDLEVFREVLIDGETALMVPPDDIEQWSEALDMLVTEPELRRVLGENSRSLVRERYTWQARVERILDAFSF